MKMVAFGILMLTVKSLKAFLCFVQAQLNIPVTGPTRAAGHHLLQGTRCLSYPFACCTALAASFFIFLIDGCDKQKNSRISVFLTGSLMDNLF